MTILETLKREWTRQKRQWKRAWEESSGQLPEGAKIEKCPHCDRPLTEWQVDGRASFLCPYCGDRVRYDEVPNMVCTVCYKRILPIRESAGSGFVALVLWLFFVIPGLIYTVWMMSTPSKLKCPYCGNYAVVPVNSPRGKELLAGKGRW